MFVMKCCNGATVVMSCSSWCGVPTAPRPVPCGVIVFLHVPKTGGTAVTQFLQHHARGGSHGWWHATATPSTPWESILARLNGGSKRPRQIIIHHVDAQWSFSDRAFQASILAPLECKMRSLGCQLILTTLLRNASSRASSAAFYNHVPHDQFMQWVSTHAQNGMINFLLHNRMRRFRRNISLPVTSADLSQAGDLLKQFDAIGRTEEMEQYLNYFGTLIRASMSTNETKPNRINRTPDKFKYELTAQEHSWTRSQTGLDATLYKSFCKSAASTCPGASMGASRSRSVKRYERTC